MHGLEWSIALCAGRSFGAVLAGLLPSYFIEEQSKNDANHNLIPDLLRCFSTDRSIRKLLAISSGRMTQRMSKWWEGLAKELQVDIETLDE